MARRLWIAIAAGAWLAPAPAGAVSLVVDRLGTPDVVQAGDTVSFSFAFQFERDEVLLATQAEISAPHLSEFTFEVAGGGFWDLAANFRQIDGGGNPMWVYAENTFSSDPQGVTWREVNGLAPLGGFSAIATYNGEIVLDLSSWELLMLDNSHIPIDPAWEHLHTGVTIVGGTELPPPPPPPAVVPPPAAPAPPPIASLPPAQENPLPAPPAGDVYAYPGTHVFDPVTEDFEGDVREGSSIACGDSGACVRIFGNGTLVSRRGLDQMYLLSSFPTDAVEAAAPEPRASVLLALGALLLLAARSAPARAAVTGRGPARPTR